MQVATSQWVVQVNRHLSLAYAAYAGVEVLTFRIHQGNDGTLNDMFAIKFAVNLESLLWQSHHLALIIDAVCIFFLNYEIEGVAFFQVLNVLLEFWQCKA